MQSPLRDQETDQVGFETCETHTTLLFYMHSLNIGFSYTGNHLDQPYNLRIAGSYSGVLEATTSTNEEWRELCFRQDTRESISDKFRQVRVTIIFFKDVIIMWG